MRAARLSQNSELKFAKTQRRAKLYYIILCGFVHMLYKLSLYLQ